jgi:hypothetical protein
VPRGLVCNRWGDAKVQQAPLDSAEMSTRMYLITWLHMTMHMMFDFCEPIDEVQYW